jgi:hypothetical protein
MDGIGRTCLGCQAELSSSARFCPKCGRPAGNTAPGGNAVPGGPEPGDGPGFTVMSPPPATPPSPAWGTTVTQPPFPAGPYQAPLPPATPPQAPPGARRPGPPQPHQAPMYPPPYPPPADNRPAYEQRPREAQGFEPFRPYRAKVPPPMGPIPTGPGMAGPPPGPPRQPPRRHDGRRSGSSLPLLIALLVLLAGGGVAGVLIARPFSHPAIKETASTGTTPTARGGQPSRSGAGPTAPASTTSPASTVSPSPSTAAPAVTERQAATNLATMLSQSVSDRAAIVSAASDVSGCGPDLNSDAKVFDNAASSRKSLLASLTTMPGRTALPAALLTDLTQAWQASIAADQAYAQWANDENTQGCVVNDTSDPGYQATVTPNANATTYKTAFAGQWNPVAAQYGLTQYTEDQL